MIQRYIKALSLAAFSVLCFNTANASVISYTDSFGTSNTTTTGTYGSSSSNSSTTNDFATVDRFDSNLGTLTGVEISFTSSWDHTANGTAYDNYTESSSYTYKCGWWNLSTCTGHNYWNDAHESSSAYSNLGIYLIDPSGSQNSISSTLNTSCSASNSGGSASCSDSASTSGSFNGTMNLSGIDLDAFINPAGDALDFRFDNYKSLNLYCDNNDAGDYCDAYSAGNWSGTITVAYTYTVPEPATLFMLSFGLIGLGLARRQTKKHG